MTVRYIFAFFLFSLLLSKESYFLVWANISLLSSIWLYFSQITPLCGKLENFSLFFSQQSLRKRVDFRDLQVISRNSRPEMFFCKKSFWKILWNLQENVCAGISLPAQLLHFRNISEQVFLEHLWIAASKLPVNFWSHSFLKKSLIRKLHEFCRYFAGKWKVLTLNYSMRVNNQKTWKDFKLRHSDLLIRKFEKTSLSVLSSSL